MARDVVMVNGLPGSGKSSLAPRLANALGAAFLSKDRIKEALADALVAEMPALGAVAMETVWLLAANSAGTVVIDSWWFRPRDLEHARKGLAASGATGVVRSGVTSRPTWPAAVSSPGTGATSTETTTGWPPTGPPGQPKPNLSASARCSASTRSSRSTSQA